MTKEEEKLVIFYLEEIEDSMSPEDFQRDFYESLSSQFYHQGSLSEKQIAALKRVYERVTS